MAEKETALRLRVGFLVLLGLVLFVAFVLAIGGQSRLFQERYTLKAAFSDVGGIVIGAPVRLAGVTVGTVSGMSFGTDPTQKKIVLDLGLDTGVQDRIREDSLASIGTIGLVGDKVLEITVGSPEKKILPAGSFLQAVDPVDYSKFLVKGDQILDNVVKMTASLDQLLGGLGDGKATEEVAGSLKSLRRTLSQVEQGKGLLHELIYDERAKRLVDDLNQASASLKKIISAVEEGDGLLHALIYGKEDPILGRFSKTVASLEESALSLRRASAAVEHLATRVEKEEGLLQALLFDPKGKEIIGDLRATSSDLKTVTEKLTKGEGTLGALLDDPTLYEDLSSLLRGAQRSAILRVLIRSSVKRGSAGQ